MLSGSSLPQVALLVLAPATLAAQTVTGRVVDRATRRPLAHVAVRLVPGADSARDTVFATGATGDDGVFVLSAPAPGNYRVRLGEGHLGPPLRLGSVDAVDEHEYLMEPIAPAADASPSRTYHVLHGAELAAVLQRGRPLLECEVDKKVDMVAGTMHPRFPARLKRVSGAGSLIAQFVVDTNGRAELATFRSWEPPNTEPEFAESTREALASARFRPAESEGRKVRQLVQLPMTFQMVGSPRPPLLKTQCAPLGGEPR